MCCDQIITPGLSLKANSNRSPYTLQNNKVGCFNSLYGYIAPKLSTMFDDIGGSKLIA